MNRAALFSTINRYRKVKGIGTGRLEQIAVITFNPGTGPESCLVRQSLIAVTEQASGQLAVIHHNLKLFLRPRIERLSLRLLHHSQIGFSSLFMRRWWRRSGTTSASTVSWRRSPKGSFWTETAHELPDPETTPKSVVKLVTWLAPWKSKERTSPAETPAT